MLSNDCVSTDCVYKEYREKFDKILANHEHNKYLFEMTKCCGYGFIQSFYKMNTLEELYHNLQLEMSHITITGIYLKDCNGVRIDIPRDSTVLLQDFFIANHAWFVPIYPLPAKVVYRVHYDDNHFHIHEDSTVNNTITRVNTSVGDDDNNSSDMVIDS